MARELTPTELEQLLGAYALDALDDGDEREQVQTHLARVPAARDEIVALHEVVALLASSGPSEPPEGLWERIEAALEAEPPRLRLPLAPSRRAARRWGLGMRVAAAVAAASAAAAVITAFVVNDEMSRQEDRLARVEARVAQQGTRRAALAAAADPTARTVHLEATGTAAVRASAMVVAMPDGEGFLMAQDLPALAPGRTYQLWAMTGDLAAPVLLSAAILGREVGVVSFRAPTGSLGFVITDEAAPGAVTSTHPGLLMGEFV